MSSPVGLLVAVCRAVTPVLTSGGSVAAEISGKVLSSIWDWWGAKARDAERRRDLEAVARMTAEQCKAAIQEALDAHAFGASAEIQAQLQSYLLAFQAQVRRASRRPSDPSGLTVSSHLALSRAEDLVPLLPPRTPRFAPGHRVAGTDLELVALLGIGGFGEVWKARNPFLPSDPPVALKFCLNPDAAASLKREAKLLDAIRREGKHPGIVDLHRTYLSADPPFLEYEWVDGGDLGGFVLDQARASGGVSPDRAARIVQWLAGATGFAHARGIVHRDLKPANVLTCVARRPDGAPEVRFKVTDFGIGEITAAATGRPTLTVGAALGSYSAHYASPEQERGEKADPRDDVHALGVMWYQMLVGDLTVPAPRGPGWKKRLKDAGVPVEHVELIEACVSSERTDRPDDGGVLAAQLGAVAGPGGGEVVEDDLPLLDLSPPPPAAPPPGRSRPVPPPLPPEPATPPADTALGEPGGWPRYRALLHALRSLRTDRNRLIWSRSWSGLIFSTLFALVAFAALSAIVGGVAKPRTVYQSSSGYSSYSSPNYYTSYGDTKDALGVLLALGVVALAADRVRVFVRHRTNPEAAPPPGFGLLTYAGFVFLWFGLICLLGQEQRWGSGDFQAFTVMLGTGGLLVLLFVAKRVVGNRLRERIISTPAAIQKEFGPELAAVAPDGIDLRNSAEVNAAITAMEEAYLVPGENPVVRAWHSLFAPL